MSLDLSVTLDFVSSSSGLLVDAYMCSGRSKGGVRDACPPGGPNSFNFMHFLGKFAKIVCWGPLGSWCPLLRETLDLPLMCINSIMY